MALPQGTGTHRVRTLRLESDIVVRSETASCYHGRSETTTPGEWRAVDRVAVAWVMGTIILVQVNLARRLCGRCVETTLLLPL